VATIFDRPQKSAPFDALFFI